MLIHSSLKIKSKVIGFYFIILRGLKINSSFFIKKLGVYEEILFMQNVALICMVAFIHNPSKEPNKEIRTKKLK